jgi:ABC-2 type transport system permease protein
MNNKAFSVKTLANKEIRDASRSRLFMIILVMLVALVIVSVVLGAFQVRVNVDSYNQSVALLKSIGKKNFPAAPSMNPLSASKSFTNYIGMLGALLGIVLGNATIRREREAGTMRLILTRQTSRGALVNGKTLGNLTLLLVISVLFYGFSAVAVPTIGHWSLTSDENLRLGFFCLIGFLYMTFFYLLSMVFAIVCESYEKALLLTVTIWLILAFILPQVGDTMDMDNQISGGFFAAMGMTRDQEKQVLSQFGFYEWLRNGFEELSPLKHFERVGFALLNVKPGFENNTALEVMGIKWWDIACLIVPNAILWFSAAMIFKRREDRYL